MQNYRAHGEIDSHKGRDDAIGPEVIGELHERLMELARERGVVQGRKMRVDTTSVAGQ